MKRVKYFLLIGVLSIFLSSCLFLKKNDATEYIEYRNSDIKIALKYPSHWKPDQNISYLANQPSRFFGSDGFLALNVIASDGASLESIANKEVQSGDYGTNPELKRIIHNAKISFIIYPSSDQSPDENQRSCFITELRNVYRSNRVNYDFFILFSDKEHLMKLVETLENL